jgi:hypothetical protein
MPLFGWMYRDEDTKKLCQSGSFAGLVDMCVRHRRTNKLDIPNGFPQIIEHQICRRLPDKYVKGRTKPVEQNILRLSQAQSRTQDLLRKWVNDGRRLVSNDVAIQRATICQHCPDNIKLGGCLTCKGIDSWVYSWIGKDKRIGCESLLHGCKSGRYLLFAIIHMNPDILEQNAGTPAHCWRREHE